MSEGRRRKWLGVLAGIGVLAVGFVTWYCVSKFREGTIEKAGEGVGSGVVDASSESEPDLESVDESQFNADPSLFHDATEEMKMESPAEHAEKEEKNVTGYLIGAWLDQENNRREFTADGVYTVEFRETKQYVEGEYRLVSDEGNGAVVLWTENPIEGRVIYAVDVERSSGEGMTDVIDGYESMENEYSLVLWAEEGKDNLVLRR